MLSKTQGLILLTELFPQNNHFIIENTGKEIRKTINNNSQMDLNSLIISRKQHVDNEKKIKATIDQLENIESYSSTNK